MSVHNHVFLAPDAQRFIPKPEPAKVVRDEWKVDPHPVPRPDHGGQIPGYDATAIFNWNELPVELACRILWHLEGSNSRELPRLKYSDKAFKSLVELEYPKHKAKLDMARRVELFFIKFKDRPLWQKMGLIGLCVLGSPFIVLYHSPKIARKVKLVIVRPTLRLVVSAIRAIYQRVLTPVGHFLRAIPGHTFKHVILPVAHLIRDIACAINNRMLCPLGRGILHAARFAYTRILTPTGHAIQATARAFFNHIVLPTVRGIRHVVHLTGRYVARPLGQLIRAIARGIFVQLPQHVYTYALRPLGNGLMNVIRFVGTHVITPIVKAIFNHLISPLAVNVWRATCWTTSHVVVPILKTVRAIAKGVFVTLPTKIYEHILKPLGKGIRAIAKFTYDNILTPLGNTIAQISKWVLKSILTPIGRLIVAGAKLLNQQILQPALVLFKMLMQKIFVEFPQVVHRKVIVPAEQQMIQLGRLMHLTFTAVRERLGF